jgi:tripartite-type tricarboxylate transporter receptor subunit TctC
MVEAIACLRAAWPNPRVTRPLNATPPYWEIAEVRTVCIRVGLAAAATLMSLQPAMAAYPQRPITMVVPFPAGGGADILARGIQHAFQQSIGGQIVVKNVPGAGGSLGAAEAARASPDGYTILLSPLGPIVLQPHRQKLTYAPDDLAPVCKLTDSPVVLMAAPDSKYKKVSDVVEAAKAAPGKITYGSAGPGSIPHMAPFAFGRAAGIDIKHIPYKGAADAIQGLLTNTIELFTDVPNLIAPYNLTPIAVFDSKRLPGYPDVPTMKEAGYDLQLSIWMAIYAPKGTPDEILAKLESGCRSTLADSKVKEILDKQTQPVDFRDRKGLGEFVATEFKKAGDLFDAAGLRVK